MKRFLLSLFHRRAFSVGDFSNGRMSVRPLTPIGADGRRTARRGALAGGGAVIVAREGGGGGDCGLCRGCCANSFNSSGGIKRSGRGGAHPIRRLSADGWNTIVRAGQAGWPQAKSERVVYDKKN